MSCTNTERPGYDEAVDAMVRLADRPRTSDWGERLTVARIEALLDAAYPLIEAAVTEAGLHLDDKQRAVLIRADERHRIVEALRAHDGPYAYPEDVHLGWHKAADFIEGLA